MMCMYELACNFTCDKNERKRKLFQFDKRVMIRFVCKVPFVEFLVKLVLDGKVVCLLCKLLEKYLDVINVFLKTLI